MVLKTISPGCEVRASLMLFFEVLQNPTQPVEPPGAGPEALLTGTGNVALHVETTGSLQSEPGSPVDGNVLDGSLDLTREESIDQELTEESSYRDYQRREVFYGLASDS